MINRLPRRAVSRLLPVRGRAATKADHLNTMRHQPSLFVRRSPPRARSKALSSSLSATDPVRPIPSPPVDERHLSEQFKALVSVLSKGLILLLSLFWIIQLLISP